MVIFCTFFNSHTQDWSRLGPGLTSCQFLILIVLFRVFILFYIRMTLCNPQVLLSSIMLWVMVFRYTTCRVFTGSASSELALGFEFWFFVAYPLTGCLQDHSVYFFAFSSVILVVYKVCSQQDFGHGQVAYGFCSQWIEVFSGPFYLFIFHFYFLFFCLIIFYFSSLRVLLSVSRLQVLELWIFPMLALSGPFSLLDTRSWKSF